jgi:hypothetical protein
LGAAAGCSKGAPDEVKKPKEVKRQTVKRKSPPKKKAAEKTEALTGQDRYDAYLRVKRNDVDERVTELEKSLRRATGRSKSRLKRQLRELKRKKGDIDVAYKKYRSSAGKGKAKARADLDNSISRFDDSSTVPTEEM